MEYVKRKYKDVKNDFVVWGQEWTNGLFHRYLTAATEYGIWLSEQSELTYDIILIGFFEWTWIKKIEIDPKKEIVYFVMKDMDACISICSFFFQCSQKKNFIETLNDGSKAIMIRLKLLSPELLSYISDNQYVDVEVVYHGE